MSDTPQLAVPLAQVATIDTDLPCFFCQYNLRTLALDGICPECGNPVQKCIRQGWLIFADPRWLAKLRRGVTIMLWLILVAVLGYAAFFSHLMYTAMASSPSGSPPESFVVRALTIVFGLGLTASWLISVWHLTAPAPIPNEGYRQSSLGRAIRILQLIFGCSAVVYLVLVGGVFAGPGFSSGAAATSTDILGLVASMIFAGAWSFGLIFLLIHMRRIARRDLKKGLGRLMTFLIWGGLAAVSLSVVSMLLMQFAVRGMILTPTTIPTTQSTAGPQVSGGVTQFSVSSWGNVSVARPVVTTASAPASTTRPGASPPPSLVGLGYATSTAVVTTMPAGAAVTGAMPFGGIYLLMLPMCAGQLLSVGWFVAGVVALFRFRGVFARAIRQNTAPPAVTGP